MLIHGIWYYILPVSKLKYMEKVRIYKTDTPIIMARKIYNHFTIGQSCTIEGFTENIWPTEPIGEVVWKFIRELDYDENYVIEPGRAPRRKYREAGGDSIGGRVAHKIFRKKREMRKSPDSNVIQLVTHIWRFQ